MVGNVSLPCVKLSCGPSPKRPPKNAEEFVGDHEQNAGCIGEGSKYLYISVYICIYIYVEHIKPSMPHLVPFYEGLGVFCRKPSGTAPAPRVRRRRAAAITSALTGSCCSCKHYLETPT